MTQSFNKQDQGESVASLIEGKPKGFAFKFKLNNDMGGTYRTDVASDVDQVEYELQQRFGVTIKSVELLGKK